jgi:SH3-like domain-containing protein
MRCSGIALLVARLMLSAGLGGLLPAAVWAQSDTLQLPSHRPTETAPPKVAPAPREPVHQVGPEHAPPVVRPHGPAHPAKPPPERQPHKPLPVPPPAHDAPAAPAGAAKPAVAVPAPAPAIPPAKPAEPDKGSTTTLPLPRFASLRTDDVNLRAGPGMRYPIDWVYKRRDLPVEIEREFEVWRLVRDPDGIRGWVHEATLTGRRSFIVEGADATLRADPRDDASPVAVLKVGVIGRLRTCAAASDWCQVQVGDYRGFLKRSQFWGTLPSEVVAPP